MALNWKKGFALIILNILLLIPAQIWMGEGEGDIFEVVFDVRIVITQAFQTPVEKRYVSGNGDEKVRVEVFSEMFIEATHEYIDILSRPRIVLEQLREGIPVSLVSDLLDDGFELVELEEKLLFLRRKENDESRGLPYEVKLLLLSDLASYGIDVEMIVVLDGIGFFINFDRLSTKELLFVSS